MLTDHPPRRSRRVVRVRFRLAAAVAALISAAVPPFLVAVLAVRIDADIGFSTVQLGGGVAAYFLVSAVCSPVAGRLVARHGAPWPLRLATLGCTVGLVATALAPNGSTVVALLAVLGMANATAQPAATHVITGITQARGRATAFGLVQSAIPATTLLAGIVLGALQAQSWRTAVLLVAAATLLAQLSLAWVRDAGPRPVPQVLADPAAPAPAAAASGDAGVPEERMRSFLAMMCCTGFAVSFASTCLPSFLVVTGLRAGLSASVVAGVQIAASLVSIAVRVLAASRGGSATGRGTVLAVVLLATGGAVGFALLAVGTAPTFVVGALVAYGLGWGWSGVFNLSVTRARPHRAAASTGVTQGGIFLGGSLGPLAFAALTHVSGTHLAWSVAAASAAVAAVCALAARRCWPHAGPDAVRWTKLGD